VISPELPPGASRWPHRVADLGPFSLVDAAASVSADRGRIAVTLVNRGLDAAPVRLVLRDFTFAWPAAVTVLTGDDGPLPEPSSAQVPANAPVAGLARVPGVTRLPGIAGVRLAMSTMPAGGPVLTVTFPPQSFAVIEVPVAAST
jgi:hypothetical protein